MSYINPNKAWSGFTIPFWLCEMPGLSFGAKILYSKLAYMAGENGYCWPSQQQLAGELNVTERTVKTLIAELKSFDLIEAKKQLMGSVIRNVYFFKEVKDSSPTRGKELPHVGEENFPTLGKKTSPLYIGRKSKEKSEGNISSEQPLAAGAEKTAMTFVHFKKLLRSKVNMDAAATELRGAIVEFVNGLQSLLDLTSPSIESYINELAHELNIIIADEKDFSIRLVRSCIGKKKIFGSKVGLLKYAAHNPYGTGTFRSAWGKWLDYRASHKIRSYASPESMNAVIRKHAELCGNEAAFIQSIEQSIANTWQGLFAPKQQRGAGAVRYTSGIEKETKIYMMARKLAGLPDFEENNNQNLIS